MAFGITTAGFVLKTFDDILSELNETAQLSEYFGPDVDLSEFGEVGIFNQLMAKAITDLWEDFEDTYFSSFPDTGEGVSLDRVVALGGLTRRNATKAIVTISASGTPGTTIPLGFLTQTAQGTQFETIIESEIVASGTSVESRAVIAGTSGIVAANTVIEIVNSTPGITDVNNLLASTGGLEIETDYELRDRFEARSTSGGSSVPAILNALLNVENVITATVNENNSDVTDGEGLPPHSVQCVVTGSATDAAIAEAIFNSKAAGINTFGSISVTVLDRNGDAHNINYDEPIEKFVNVIVNITSNSEWVAANVTAVKTACVEAIGGVDTVGLISTEYTGLEVGEDVQSYIVLTKFDGITGIDTVQVLIAFSPTTPVASTTLVIGSSEISRSDTANITVNVS